MIDAELAILSIVAESEYQGRSGWDVQRIIDERNMRLWTLIGVESIHYVLEKLEKQKLIQAMNEAPKPKRRERVYRITAAGIGVLQTSVTDLLSSPRHMPHRFAIGLSNLHVMRTAQVRHALLSYQNALQHRYNSLGEKYSDLIEQEADFHILSMFEHELALLRAELDWFEKWFPKWDAQAPLDKEPEIQPSPKPPRMEQVILPQDPDSLHKRETRHHDAANPQMIDGVEYPPPPKKRGADKDETKANNPTPPFNKL